MNRRELMHRAAGLTAAMLPLGVATTLARAADATAAKPCRLPDHMSFFPNITLWTHDGEKVSFYTDLAKGKVFTINFMYTHCELSCPGITQNLIKVQRMLGSRIGKDVFMYSVTVDPDNDTPAVLNDYVQANGIGPGWTLLTGAKADVERLRRAFGLVDIDPVVDKQKSRHTGMIRIVNEPELKFVAAAAQGSASEIVRHIKGVFPVATREVPPAPGNFGRHQGPIVQSAHIVQTGTDPMPFLAVTQTPEAGKRAAKTSNGDTPGAANR